MSYFSTIGNLQYPLYPRGIGPGIHHGNQNLQMLKFHGQPILRIQIPHSRILATQIVTVIHGLWLVGPADTEGRLYNDAVKQVLSITVLQMRKSELR